MASDSLASSVNKSFLEPLGYDELQEKRLMENSEEDFEKWRKCLKCHNPLEKPMALQCLHTICLHCLKIHYRIVKLQVAASERETPEKYNFFSWGCLLPCPVCNYPCYMLADSVITLPSNRHLLKLSFKERLHWYIKMKYALSSKKLSNLDDQSNFSKSSTISLIHKEISKYLCQLSIINQEKMSGLLSDSSVSATNTSVSPPSKSGCINRNDNSSFLVPDSRNFHRDVSRDSGSRSDVIFTLSQSSSELNQSESNEQLGDMGSGITPYLESHWSQVMQEFGGSIEKVEMEDDATLPDECAAELLVEYNLKYGDDNLEVRHPNAIAVNQHTGHVIVADTTWNKAVLYKTHTRPYGYKKFDHPIVDVCFYPHSRDHPERFCAMGRRADVKGIMVYTAIFNKNPLDFQCMYQKNLRDVSGILVIEPDILFLSLPYANSVIRSINERQFIDLATRSQHGLFYPTHITHTEVGEVVVADTGNHRIAVFYGPQYMAFDFYGEFGSEYGKFFYPLGLAADKQRFLYICDSNNYRVQIFDGSFKFYSCPIKRTFLMSDSVSQDVKPVDCAVNNKQKLLVLFRGRGFISLQAFNCFGPVLKHTPTQEVEVPIPEKTCCWCCYLCCLCSCEVDRPDRRKYEVIN